jgi:hypothetical protein
MAMFITTFAAPILLLAMQGTAMRNEQELVSADGRQWNAVANRHGAVLRSNGEIVYLGHSCDARSPTLGTGRWEFANGGFVIIMRRRAFGFPRQGIHGLTHGQRCLAR